MGLFNGSFLRRRDTEANASRRDISRNAEKKVYDETTGHEEVSALSTEPGPGVWKLFVDIIAVIGALVAIIIPAVNWDKLKTPFACAVVIIGAILFALAVARLARRRKARRLDLDAILDIAVVGAFCICVTAAIISVFGSTSTDMPSNSTK